MSIELPCKAAALNASTFSALPRAKNIFLIVTGYLFHHDGESDSDSK